MEVIQVCQLLLQSHYHGAWPMNFLANAIKFIRQFFLADKLHVLIYPVNLKVQIKSCLKLLSLSEHFLTFLTLFECVDVVQVNKHVYVLIINIEQEITPFNLRYG